MNKYEDEEVSRNSTDAVEIGVGPCSAIGDVERSMQKTDGLPIPAGSEACVDRRFSIQQRLHPVLLARLPSLGAFCGDVIRFGVCDVIGAG